MTLSTTKIGLIAGLLFFSHALIPYSHAWPLIWPLLGGALAMHHVSRRRDERGFWGLLSASAKAGLVAGLFFFVTTAAAFILLSQTSLAPLAASLGAAEGITLSTPVILSLALAALIGVAATIFSGSLTYPFVRSRPS